MVDYNTKTPSAWGIKETTTVDKRQLFSKQMSILGMVPGSTKKLKQDTDGLPHHYNAMTSAPNSKT